MINPLRWNDVPRASRISFHNFITSFVIIIILSTLYFISDLVLDKFLKFIFIKTSYNWNYLNFNTNIYFINNLLSIVKNFMFYWWNI